jgi:class I fructose-bisphosphate aldolase
MADPTIRSQLDDLNLSTGKKARLHRLLYHSGPANGTLLILPIDQGLEHGPRDFLDSKASGDPRFQFRVAVEGGYSAIAVQIGLAEKYYPEFAGKIPLVVKLNGKTEVPPDDAPFSPLNATVEDAVRLGADAVGYTLYVGSSRQDEDFRQFAEVRRDAIRWGMPIIAWAYPRGSAIESKGGKDSLFAVDYAARTAQELGADVIKLNVPSIDPGKLEKAPAAYRRPWTEAGALAQVISSAGKSMVIFAGGERGTIEETIQKAKICMDAGATGLIFGRSVWQRPYAEALEVSKAARRLLESYGI